MINLDVAPTSTRDLWMAAATVHPMFPTTGNAAPGWDKIRTSKRAAGQTIRQILGLVFKTVESEMKPEEAAKALAAAFGLTNGDAGLIVPIAMAVAQVKRTDIAWQSGLVDPNDLPAQVIKRGLLAATSESRAAALEQVDEAFRPRIEEVLAAEEQAVQVLMANPRDVVGAAKAISAIIRGPQAIELVKGPLMEEAQRRIAVAEAEAKAKAVPAVAEIIAAEETPAPAAEPPSADEIEQTIVTAIAAIRPEVRKLLAGGNVQAAVNLIEAALDKIQIEDKRGEAEKRTEAERKAMIAERAPEIRKALEADDLQAAQVVLMEVGVYEGVDSAEAIEAVLQQAGAVKAEEAPAFEPPEVLSAVEEPVGKDVVVVEPALAESAPLEEVEEPAAEVGPDPVDLLIAAIEAAEGGRFSKRWLKDNGFRKGLEALLAAVPEASVEDIATKLSKFTKPGPKAKDWARLFDDWSATKAGPVGTAIAQLRKGNGADESEEG